jgi:hypothetical protein
MDNKTGGIVIIKKNGIKYHHIHPHIPVTSFENMDSNKKYQEKYMLILRLQRKKIISKKTEQILVDKLIQQK